MRGFFAFWITSMITLGVTAWVLPGVRVDSLAALAVSALVIGLLNSSVKPILQILAFPVTVVTLGLFYFVINGLVFALAAWLVPGFAVAGFLWAVLGALFMGVVSVFVGGLMSPSTPRRR